METVKFVGRIQELIPILFKIPTDIIVKVVIEPFSGKKKKKRTEQQNDYAWALIGKMAKALKVPKDEIYLDMLYNYGTSSTYTIKKGADLRPFKRCYKKVVESTEIYDVVAFIVGSSDYDTKEMSQLIDGIRAECENMGINPDLGMEQWLKM